MPDGLRVRAAALYLIGLAAVVVLSAGARGRLPLGELYPLKSAVWFVAIATFAVVFIGDDTHPFNRLGPANRVTTARAVFVAFVAGAIGEPASPMLAASAAGAGLVVTMMDGVDGWMARRSHMASRFGARFDMEIDALLILALAVLTWQNGKAGGWVVLSGLIRYGFVVAGWLLPKMRAPLPDSRRRQTICVVQIAALIIALEPFVTRPASELIASAALAALCYSFAVDTMWLVRRSFRVQADATLTTAGGPAFLSSSAGSGASIPRPGSL
jgi:phosphatidylglycerophosphate synthase